MADFIDRVLERLQDLQIRPQKQRHVIIRLVHDLLGNHRDAITAMGTEFLVGVIDLFSGEKDPRNLMLIFSVVIVVATEWDLGSHVEVSIVGHYYVQKTNERNRHCSIVCSATIPSRFDPHQMILTRSRLRISRIDFDSV